MQIVKIQETAKFTDFEFLLTILSLHFSASLVASIFVNIPLFQDPLSHQPPPPLFHSTTILPAACKLITSANTPHSYHLVRRVNLLTHLISHLTQLRTRQHAQSIRATPAPLHTFKSGPTTPHFSLGIIATYTTDA